MQGDAVPGEDTPVLNVVMGVMSLPDRRFLIAQRAAHKMYGGFWEFPGGKTRPGESPEQALHREFLEELDIGITIDRRLDEYSYLQDETLIRFVPFCGRLQGTDIRLLEHQQVSFIHVAELGHYSFAPPDYEIVNRLMEGTVLP